MCRTHCGNADSMPGEPRGHSPAQAIRHRGRCAAAGGWPQQEHDPSITYSRQRWRCGRTPDPPGTPWLTFGSLEIFTRGSTTLNPLARKDGPSSPCKQPQLSLSVAGHLLASFPQKRSDWSCSAIDGGAVTAAVPGSKTGGRHHSQHPWRSRRPRRCTPDQRWEGTLGSIFWLNITHGHTNHSNHKVSQWRGESGGCSQRLLRATEKSVRTCGTPGLRSPLPAQQSAAVRMISGPLRKDYNPYSPWWGPSPIIRNGRRMSAGRKGKPAGPHQLLAWPTWAGSTPVWVAMPGMRRPCVGWGGGGPVGKTC